MFLDLLAETPNVQMSFVLKEKNSSEWIFNVVLSVVQSIDAFTFFALVPTVPKKNGFDEKVNAVINVLSARIEIVEFAILMTMMTADLVSILERIAKMKFLLVIESQELSLFDSAPRLILAPNLILKRFVSSLLVLATSMLLSSQSNSLKIPKKAHVASSSRLSFRLRDQMVWMLKELPKKFPKH